MHVYLPTPAGRGHSLLIDRLADGGVEVGKDAAADAVEHVDVTALAHEVVLGWLGRLWFKCGLLIIADKCEHPFALFCQGLCLCILGLVRFFDRLRDGRPRGRGSGSRTMLALDVWQLEVCDRGAAFLGRIHVDYITAWTLLLILAVIFSEAELGVDSVVPSAQAGSVGMQ